METDRRDAAILARLHRATELTEVSVPDAAHEASENESRETISSTVLSRSAFHARRPVQRGAESLGEPYGIVIGPEVHEDDPWLLGEHVAVNRRHVDTVGAQRAHDVVDLGADEDEIAGDRRLAATGRLKVDGRRATHGGHPDHHSFLGDGIAARDVELIDPAVGRTLDTDDLVELGGVEIDGRRRSWRRRKRERRLADGQSTADGLGPFFTGSPCPPTCM
jgi:hypothetical protein